MLKHPAQLQKDFLTKVAKASNLKKSKFITVLMETLHIGKDSAYKRMRGDTMLNLEELNKLSERLDFAIDDFLQFNSLRSTCFLPSPVHSYQDYLQQVVRKLRFLKSCEEKKLWYSSQELPSSFYFFYPELAAFKLYYWGVTNWQIPDIEQLGFSLNTKLSKGILGLLEEINSLYLMTPSTEFWHSQMISNYYKQILFCLQYDHFKQVEDALQLTKLLNQLWQHLEHVITTGVKTHPLRVTAPQSPIHIYYNEIMYPENISLIKTNLGDYAFQSINYPDTISYRSETFCQQTEKSFQRIQRYSRPVSGNAWQEKHFFRSVMRRNIQTLNQQILDTVEQKQNSHHISRAL